jgi:hypothetical protein
MKALDTNHHLSIIAMPLPNASIIAMPLLNAAGMLPILVGNSAGY